MQIKIKSFLYYLLLITIMFDSSIADTVIPSAIKDSLHTICLLLIMTLAVVNICLKKLTIKRFCIYMVVFLFSIYSYYCSTNTEYMISAILVLMTFGENLDKVLRYAYVVRLFMFVSTVIMSLVGILDKGLISFQPSEKGVLLGYVHANVFAGNVGVLILLYIALNRRNLTFRRITKMFVLTICVYMLSGTRIFLGLIGLVLFLVIFIKRFRKENKFCKYSHMTIPTIAILNFMLIFMRAYGIAENIVKKIDVIFHGRIFLASMNLSYYPITLFGRRVNIDSIASQNYYYALDNGYTYLVIYYGIVGLLIILMFLHIGTIRASKSKEWVLCIISLATAIWMMYEGMMTSATTNFVMLYFGCELSKIINERRFCIDSKSNSLLLVWK